MSTIKPMHTIGVWDCYPIADPWSFRIHGHKQQHLSRYASNDFKVTRVEDGSPATQQECRLEIN